MKGLTLDNFSVGDILILESEVMSPTGRQFFYNGNALFLITSDSKMDLFNGGDYKNVLKDQLFVRVAASMDKPLLMDTSTDLRLLENFIFFGEMGEEEGFKIERFLTSADNEDRKLGRQILKQKRIDYVG